MVERSNYLTVLKCAMNAVTAMDVMTHHIATDQIAGLV
jgi:hypothetical protein